MADDITLTIRVRDLTHGDFARMNQRLVRMRQNLRDVGGSGRTASVHTTRLGRDIDTLGNSFLRMRNNGTLTRSELDRMRASLRGMGRDARHSYRAGDLTRTQFRAIRSELRGLNGDFNRVGRSGNIFRRMATSLKESTGHFAHLSRAALIFLAVLVLIGPAAQAIGALLITALAASFVALGAFALRGSAQVKSAFKDMKTSIGSAVREAAKPMEGALVAGMQQLGKAAHTLQPLLTQAFTATAPLVKDLVGGITNLAAGALPGMTAALESAGPAMKGFKNAMGDVGEGIGDMFKKMTVGNEKGLERAWATLGTELQNLLTNIGEFIANMSKSQSATLLFIGIFRSLSGVLHLIEAAFKGIDAVFGPLFKKINDAITGMSGLGGGAKKAASGFNFMGDSADDLRKKLADTQDKIKKIKEDTADIRGPGKKYAQEGKGLPGLEQKEAALKKAIAAASGDVTLATKGESAAVADLINKIRDLNELNLGSLDARAALEQSIDDATENYKKYGRALKYTHGQLDLNSDASRVAYGMLSKIATATNDATKKAQDAHEPWANVIAEWKRGRSNVIRLADGMGLTKKQAQKLADTIVKMPDKKVHLKATIADLSDKIKNAKSLLKRVPDSRKAKVRADIAELKRKLAAARGELASLHGRTVTVTVRINGVKTGVNPDQYYSQGPHKGSAHGGLPRRYAQGGDVQTFPGGGYVRGPGSATSDSITALSPQGGMYRVSDSEYVVQSTAVKKYGIGFLNALNSGRLRLAGFKRGGLAKGEKSARSEARGELSISHFGRMAGYKNDEFRNALGLPDALGGLVSSLNHWRSVIMKATHGGLEKSLLKQLDKAGKSLIKYEKSLTKVEKSLDKAKTKLDDLRSAASQLKESVKSGVMSATNITRNTTSEKNLTVANLMTSMTEGRDKATAFSSALKRLKKKGVSKQIIQQIAEAGIEGGGLQTAGTLLTASSSEIDTMNKMQGQINKAAKASGKTAADAMYAAGIKAAEGLVKGLTKKKKDIEKAMMHIAKAMEKAIKRALGIHSPSKVMQEVGHFTAEGFAVGIRKNRSSDHAWSSMLTTKSTTPGGGSSSYGGGGAPMVIHVKIGDRVLEEIWVDTGRRAIRTRGGNAQAVLGRRTS